MARKTTILNFEEEIMKALYEMGDKVFIANEKALDAASKVLIKELKNNSPEQKPPGKTIGKKFKKSWKSTGKKYKQQRYVYNSKMVKDKKGTEIPLANILEYSAVRGKPFIKKTYEGSIKKMVDAYVKKMKEEI